MSSSSIVTSFKKPTSLDKSIVIFLSSVVDVDQSTFHFTLGTKTMESGNAIGILMRVLVSLVDNFLEIGLPDRCPVIPQDLQCSFKGGVQERIIDVNPSLDLCGFGNG